MRWAFSRPGGTLAGADDDPALKRRAIVGLSRWDEDGRRARTMGGTIQFGKRFPARRRKRQPGRSRAPFQTRRRRREESQIFRPKFLVRDSSPRLLQK